MKKCIALFALLLVLFPVFAGGSGEEDVVVRIFQQKIEIHDALVAAAEAFNATHEGITVEVESSGDDYLTILKGQFAAGDGPAIFQSNGYNDMALFRDYLVDLSDEDWAQYLTDVARETGSLDGKV